MLFLYTVYYAIYHKKKQSTVIHYIIYIIYINLIKQNMMLSTHQIFKRKKSFT